MGIFRKILAWNNHGVSPDTATVVSLPGRTDSELSELIASPMESSRIPEAVTPGSFPTSSDWKEERADGLQTFASNSLPSRNEEFLDQVVDAFDEAFDTACVSSVSTHSSDVAGAVQNVTDETAVQDLFVQIAANYSQPLRNFAFDLKRGMASKDSIDFLRSSLQMIGSAAARMDLAQTVKRITDFDEVLSMVQARSEQLLEDHVRDLILNSQQALAEVLPDVLPTDQEQQRREDLIIRSLLQQIPGVGRVTLEKLYRAGVGTLEALFLANRDDLAAATSIPVPLCERIVEKFQRHRAEAQERSQQDPPSGFQACLVSLVADLRDRQEELDTAEVGANLNRTLAAEKRRRRQLRQNCFLQVVATLAELGEIELINKIQKLPFKQRLKRLEEHLSSVS
jgi:DNA repair protein RadA